MENMKLKQHSRNLLHKDAIEREWPSGPHGSDKRKRIKAGRQGARREIEEALDMACPDCGGYDCIATGCLPCDYDGDWDIYLLETAADSGSPEAKRIMKQYLVVDETEN